MLKKLILGLTAALAIGCGGSEEKPNNHLEVVPIKPLEKLISLDFYNRQGSHYPFRFREKEGRLVNEHYWEKERTYHYIEAASDHDYKIKEGDSFIITDGNYYHPSGTPKSNTRIMYYLYYGEDWLEIWDIGSKGGGMTPRIYTNDKGQRFFFLEFPENMYIGYVSEDGSLAVDQNGWSSIQGKEITWGEKINITKHDGEVVDLDELIRKDRLR